MKTKENKRIYLAGGCFWGVQKYLAMIPGVVHTETGYANGETDSPSYQDVLYKKTGHAETVMAEYDPAMVPLEILLELFYQIIDPTSLNRQGYDSGTMYRTGIYYTNPADLDKINYSIARLAERMPRPVVVEVKALKNYFPAEEYHQDYLGKNPRGYCHIPLYKYEGIGAALEKIMDNKDEEN